MSTPMTASAPRWAACCSISARASLTPDASSFSYDLDRPPKMLRMPAPTSLNTLTPSTPWAVTTPRYSVTVRPSIPGVVVMSIAVLLQGSWRSVGTSAEARWAGDDGQSPTIGHGGLWEPVVLGLGQLLGRDSSLVVAAATLAVAALFQPARRRVQAAVDRRFNRRRHDAAQRIAAFTGPLPQHADPGTLTAELLAVAEQIMQPTTVSLWLRPPVAHSTAATR